MVTGFGGTYVLLKPYNGEPNLLRTKDYGDTWESAPVGTVRGVEHIALDPLDGRLWLGVKGGVTGLDPTKLKWTRAAAQAASRAVATSLPGKPAATAQPCAMQLTGDEAQINGRGLGLGCPNGLAQIVQMARQRFQYGQMIWRQDLKAVYVLYNDGRWAGYPDTWYENDPADDPSLTPPAGLQQPVRGFGKVWREQLGGVKAKTGWAIEKEAGVQGQVQPWQYGMVLRFGGEVLVLHSDGRWQ